MFFYKERKSSCVERHSELKTTTTRENTCTLTKTWFFMKSEKVHLLNVIHSWRSLRLEETYSRWPKHDFLWRAKNFMWWMSFKVEDHYDLRKHLHVDYNMNFYEERKSSCDECHTKLKTTTTWENTCTLTITWFFMKSEKVHVMNVIQSQRPLRLEKTLAHWPRHDFLWRVKKFMWFFFYHIFNLSSKL